MKGLKTNFQEISTYSLCVIVSNSTVNLESKKEKQPTNFAIMLSITDAKL